MVEDQGYRMCTKAETVWQGRLLKCAILTHFLSYADRLLQEVASFDRRTGAESCLFDPEIIRSEGG